MSEDDQRQRLAQLEEKLAARRKAQEPEPKQQDMHSQAQLAWRMVMELVAGLGIGFGMGYGLDALFGTKPIFMIVFTFFGFAAGIKTMLRSAEEVRQASEASLDGAVDMPDDDKDEDDAPRKG
ncbi:AtpZ/AtpI family protein [Chachezhania sediminis]|uniref:AtpZ/AtpI family protein n=1 Tax=Chachezhania sediminis TaxID=2599291 RepID=UPI00131D42BA|nr:AtpZ/AtpI family protein [Chachezhania sediminis]